MADVVSWEQCLSDNQAWDTLTWFAALIAMASYLNKYGFIAWFSDKASKVFFLGWGVEDGESVCLGTSS